MTLARIELKQSNIYFKRVRLRKSYQPDLHLWFPSIQDYNDRVYILRKLWSSEIQSLRMYYFRLTAEQCTDDDKLPEEYFTFGKSFLQDDHPLSFKSFDRKHRKLSLFELQKLWC